MSNSTTQGYPGPPNLSEVPPTNGFLVNESFKSGDLMARLLDRLLDEGEVAYARIDLALPLGCPFRYSWCAGTLGQRR